ncbi:FtsQ-type POTRA domain-containing protein [bacterium]|nr:FtsQ-type POTRA domain-containing protein [bacterium]
MSYNFNENEYNNEGRFNNDDELGRLMNPDKTEETTIMRRSMEISRKQRQIRQKGLLLIRLRGLLRFLITLLILYFTYRLMTAAKWYLPKDTINSYEIKRIQIVGNKITPTYKIVTSISDIELPHKPIYMINTDEFSRKISALDAVKKVYIKRLWAPARIIIYVEEREPVLTIAPSKDVTPIAYFSKDGKLVGRDYLPLPKEYNPILVLSYGNQNDDYTKWSKDKVLSIEKLAKTLEKSSGEKVQYIDMRKPEDIYVKLTSIKIRIGEIDGNTYNRIKDIKSILKKTESFEKKIKYIDLSWDESKYLKLGQDEETNDEQTIQQPVVEEKDGNSTD